MIAERDWERAVDLLRDARQVALACHVDPDGDAIGSMLALQLALNAQGVEVVAGWGSDGDGHAGPLVIPPQYTFLPGLDNLVPPDDFPPRPEVMVALDTASPTRLGTLRPVAEAAGSLIVIDHHWMGEPFGDVRLVDGDAAATAVLVEELLRRLGGSLDRDIATCLYVALVTDTGRFGHANTTPDVLRLAAELVTHGVDLVTINRQVWETHSFGYIKVLGRALERSRLVPEAGLAWTAVRQADLDDLGVAWQETEGFIDVLRRVEAAEVTMVAKEQPNRDGRWKVSLRSRGSVDVGHLAQRLGGGGHRLAAGFTAEGSLEEVVDRVVGLLAARAVGAGSGVRS